MRLRSYSYSVLLLHVQIRSLARLTFRAVKQTRLEVLWFQRRSRSSLVPGFGVHIHCPPLSMLNELLGLVRIQYDAESSVTTVG